MFFKMLAKRLIISCTIKTRSCPNFYRVRSDKMLTKEICRVRSCKIKILRKHLIGSYTIKIPEALGLLSYLHIKIIGDNTLSSNIHPATLRVFPCCERR